MSGQRGGGQVCPGEEPQCSKGSAFRLMSFEACLLWWTTENPCSAERLCLQTETLAASLFLVTELHPRTDQVAGCPKPSFK